MKDKEISLSNGMKVKVSEGDYERAAQYNWFTMNCENRKLYAYAWINNTNISMHSFILGNEVPEGHEIDHANLDGLDNRRENLRPATRSQNMANCPKRKGTHSSIYKGVCRLRDNYFKAYIMHQYRRIHLGYFKCEEDAARAYDEAARRYFGEFARLNFPDAIAA